MSEYHEQVALIDWFKYQYPHLILFAIPNGEYRHIATAVKLKKSGVLAGASDLFLAYPNKNHSGLFIEMKAKGGSVSENQKKFIKSVKQYGYAAEVCYGFDEAKSVIENYLKS